MNEGLPPAQLTLLTLVAEPHTGLSPSPGRRAGFSHWVPQPLELMEVLPRRGSWLHAFGNHCVSAIAALESSSDRALESLKTGLDPWAPPLTPWASVPTSVRCVW